MGERVSAARREEGGKGTASSRSVRALECSRPLHRLDARPEKALLVEVEEVEGEGWKEK